MTPPGALGSTSPSAETDGGAGPPPPAPDAAAAAEATLDGGAPTDARGDDSEQDASRWSDVQSIDAPANDGQPIDAPGPADGALAGPHCDPAHAWIAPAARIPSLSQATFGRFGGIGADELTIAWTSAAGAVYVADRAARGGAFAAPTTIDTSSTPLAADRVALDATGMVVFAVAADRTQFIAFTRPGVGAAWSASAPLQFANVHAMASAEVGGQFFDPVLGADGRSFFYILSSTDGPPVLYESKWDAPADAWSIGVALTSPELSSADGGTPTYATGASSDALTLFFHDGASAHQRAAWRDTPTSPFVRFTDLPGIFEAAPNYRCDALYFQGTDSGGAGAFIAQ